MVIVPFFRLYYFAHFCFIVCGYSITKIEAGTRQIAGPNGDENRSTQRSCNQCARHNTLILHGGKTAYKHKSFIK